MKFRIVIAAITLLIFTGASTLAAAGENQKDPRALEVLNKMAAYSGSIDQLVLKGEVFADARLDAGLIISNPSEIIIKVDRPGSLFLQTFDGVDTKQIYIHEGMLTLYSSETNFYARSEVPKSIDEAMRFMIDRLDIELPLAEVIFAESGIELLTDQDTIMYLTDKARIAGVDCHHIVIRGQEMDLQLWVEAGDQPTARKMTMSMKWEGGSPRRSALMKVSKKDKLDARTFEFKPPEGAQEISFVSEE